jgi:N-acyl homoserine lactone hydrolase
VAVPVSPTGLRVYVLCGGQLELDLALMLPDRAPGSRWTVPVPAFLVDHARGRLLFDTGVHCAAITDPVGRLGESRARRFGVRSGPGDDVVSQLGLLGLRPDEVTHVANSHFHFDHCGGNEFFPRSTFLVQRRELEAARDPAVLAERRYAPSAPDFDHPLAYQPVDGEHDVFGDGTVVLIPTHGHTPGHQSLRVRVGKGPDLILAADACYTRENLDRTLVPGVFWDADEMTRSLVRLRDLRDRQGATIIYGHDPAQWRELPHAPEPLVLS